ncbi:MAG: hypothetical protein ABI395_07430 [Sphingobium sp.]
MTTMNATQMSTLERSERAMMAAAVLLAPIAASALLVLPVYVGGLIDGLRLTPPDALFIVSMDLWGMAAALVPAYFLMRSLSWRRVAFAMLLGSILCFAAPAMHVVRDGGQAIIAIAAWRFMGGLCSGVLMAIVLATLGRLKQADRAFSLWVLVQILFKVLAIYCLSAVLTRWAVQGFFLVLAGLALVGLPLVRFLPGRAAAQRGSTRPAWSLPALSAIAGLALFYVALSAIWANFEGIGKAVGFGHEQVAIVLSLTSLAGLAGASLSTLLIGRVPRHHALIAGIMVIAAAAFWLGRLETLTVFTFVGAAFAFAWFFNVPLLLGSVNANDCSGGLMVFANAAIACGVAGGSSLSGLILFHGDYTLLAVLGAAAFGIVLLLMLPGGFDDVTARRRS